MFDAYDRDDPGRQLPHHRFYVEDRTDVGHWRGLYRTFRGLGLSAQQARADIIRALLHYPEAKFR